MDRRDPKGLAKLALAILLLVATALVAAGCNEGVDKHGGGPSKPKSKASSEASSEGSETTADDGGEADDPADAEESEDDSSADDDEESGDEESDDSDDSEDAEQSDDAEEPDDDGGEFSSDWTRVDKRDAPAEVLGTAIYFREAMTERDVQAAEEYCSRAFTEGDGLRYALSSAKGWRVTSVGWAHADEGTVWTVVLQGFADGREEWESLLLAQAGESVTPASENTVSDWLVLAASYEAADPLASYPLGRTP